MCVIIYTYLTKKNNKNDKNKQYLYNWKNIICFCRKKVLFLYYDFVAI